MSLQQILVTINTCIDYARRFISQATERVTNTHPKSFIMKQNSATFRSILLVAASCLMLPKHHSVGLKLT